nr:hypothetical protein [Pedobacter panaciterrae]
MEYCYKYNIVVKLEFSDKVFNTITYAIKSNKETAYSLRSGHYWNICTQHRKYSKYTTATLKQLEDILLKSLEPLKTDYQLNQEYREYVIDLYNTLYQILKDASGEMGILNDPDLKYSTPILFG